MQHATTGPVVKKSAEDEDKKLMPADVSLEGPLMRYGLTDWKVYVPAGLALSVPFLANEVRAVSCRACGCTTLSVLSMDGHESSLSVCCFR